MNLKQAIKLADDLFYGRILPSRIAERTIAEAMHTLSLNVDLSALEDLEAEEEGHYVH